MNKQRFSGYGLVCLISLWEPWLGFLQPWGPEHSQLCLLGCPSLGLRLLMVSIAVSDDSPNVGISFLMWTKPNAKISTSFTQAELLLSPSQAAQCSGHSDRTAPDPHAPEDSTHLLPALTIPDRSTFQSERFVSPIRVSGTWKQILELNSTLSRVADV